MKCSICGKRCIEIQQREVKLSSIGCLIHAKIPVCSDFCEKVPINDIDIHINIAGQVTSLRRKSPKK